MKLFGGIFYKNGKQLNEEFVTHIRKPYSLSTTLKLNDNAVFFSNDAPGIRNNCSIYKDEVSGCVISGVVNLYRKNELKHQLNIRNTDTVDVAIIVECYKQYGEKCVQYLNGEFAFVIYDPNNSRFFCARDRIGHYPLYYYADNDLFFFANNIQVLSTLKITNELNDSWIIDFLQFSNSYKDKTVFKHIKCIPPASILVADNSKIKIDLYWTLEAIEAEEYISEEDAIEGLSWHLQNAISCRLDSVDKNKVGIELTGGIDSSTVAALLAIDLRNKKLSAYTNTVSPIYKNLVDDEWQEAHRISEYLSISEHYAVEETIAKPLEIFNRTLDIVGCPFNSFISFDQQGIYDLARKQGVTTMFTGIGGDEMISAFSRGAYIHSLVRAGRVKALVGLLKNQSYTFTKAYGLSAYYFLKYYLNAKKNDKQKWLNLRWKYMILNDACLNLQYSTFFNKPFSSLDLSIKKKSFLDLSKGAFVQRLVTGNLVASAYGIKYMHPLLDVPLLEFYYKLPDKLKADHKNGRALIRKAMKDKLPMETLGHTKRRIGIPFAVIERRDNFEQMKDWCLSLSKDHILFNYVDRHKLSVARNDDSPASVYVYTYLKCAAMFSVFINKWANIELY